MFEEIIRLINYIGNEHERFSNQFFNTHKSINLKKMTVNKVIAEKTYNEKFIFLIDAYIEEVTFFQILNRFESNHPIIETRFRGKNRESTLNKLYHYRLSKYDSSIPVNKTLNDLLGFRLIIDYEFDYDELERRILNSEDILVELFRPYVRRDDGYTAIHIYFKSSNNQFFPWELQIWKKIDEVSNENSHKNHKEKRLYINWTEIYKENKHREE